MVAETYWVVYNPVYLWGLPRFGESAEGYFYEIYGAVRAGFGAV